MPADLSGLTDQEKELPFIELAAFLQEKMYNKPTISLLELQAWIAEHAMLSEREQLSKLCYVPVSRSNVKPLLEVMTEDEIRLGLQAAFKQADSMLGWGVAEGINNLSFFERELTACNAYYIYNEEYTLHQRRKRGIGASTAE